MEGKSLESGNYQIISLRVNQGEGEVTSILVQEQVFPQKSPYIKINLATHKMTGSTGFNLFGAGFKPKANKLRMDPVLATRQEGERVEAFELNFLKALNQVDSYFFDGEELHFKDDKGENLIIAKPLKE